MVAPGALYEDMRPTTLFPESRVRNIAYLSTEKLDGYYVYDELTVAPLLERDIAVQTLPWRSRAVDWSSFDAVVIRSTWDYQAAAGEFLDALEDIEAAPTVLLNDLSVVRWNLDKSYLCDLESRGIGIVPSHFAVALDAARLERAFDDFGVDEIVAKPTVSANADATFRLRRGDEAALARAEVALGKRSSLVQPFLHSVVKEGEFSLFYFGGEFSHAILKTPADGDFRVQEEHGGRLRAIDAELALRARADAALSTLSAIGHETLYARVDLVRHAGDFVVMELELIEPSLYFQLDAASPARFADALVARLDRG